MNTSNTDNSKKYIDEIIKYFKKTDEYIINFIILKYIENNPESIKNIESIQKLIKQYLKSKKIVFDKYINHDPKFKEINQYDIIKCNKWSNDIYGYINTFSNEIPKSPNISNDSIFYFMINAYLHLYKKFYEHYNNNINILNNGLYFQFKLISMYWLFSCIFLIEFLRVNYNDIIFNPIKQIDTKNYPTNEINYAELIIYILAILQTEYITNDAEKDIISHFTITPKYGLKEFVDTDPIKTEIDLFKIYKNLKKIYDIMSTLSTEDEISDLCKTNYKQLKNRIDNLNVSDLTNLFDERITQIETFDNDIKSRIGPTDKDKRLECYYSYLLAIYCIIFNTKDLF